MGGKGPRNAAADARSFLCRNGHSPPGRHPVASLLAMPVASCVATGTPLRVAIRSLPPPQTSPFPARVVCLCPETGHRLFLFCGIFPPRSSCTRQRPAPCPALMAIPAFLLDFYPCLCHRKRAVDLTAMSRKEFPCHPTVPSLPVARYLSRHADRLPCVPLPAGSASPARRSHVPFPHLPAGRPAARPRP